MTIRKNEMSAKLRRASSSLNFFLLAALVPIALSSCAHQEARSIASETPAKVPAVRRTIDASYVPPADLSKIKVAFFDADSTLRVAPSGSVSANGATDVKLLPYMAKTLRRLADDGYLLYIVSNQGGIAAKIVTFDTADAALRHTIRLILAEGGTMHGYDFAEDDVNRKPKAAMKHELEKALQVKYGPAAKIDLRQSFMVGDSAYKKGVDVEPNGKPGTHFSNADRKFAESVGIRFYEPTDFFGWREHGVDIFLKAEEVDAFYAKCEADPKCAGKFRGTACTLWLSRP
jgi:DNA 3'-phosphatase